MEAKRPSDQDLQLRTLLRSWDVPKALPPGFEGDVWRRIALTEARSEKPSRWTEFRAWIEHGLARPALAAGYLTLLLGAGLTAGWWQGHDQAAEIESALGHRYVQTVDPYQH